jgi:hypothetical protein
MLANFKSMPTVLKFFTCHALACFILLAASIIPSGSFNINGRVVSYSEWWSSGVGPFASSLGIAGPVVALLLLKKRRHARAVYLGFLVTSLVLPYPMTGESWLALVGLAITGLAAAYLYRTASVARYFFPNHLFNSGID